MGTVSSQSVIGANPFPGHRAAVRNCTARMEKEDSSRQHMSRWARLTLNTPCPLEKEGLEGSLNCPAGEEKGRYRVVSA